jgi:hypothetical protein
LPVRPKDLQKNENFLKKTIKYLLFFILVTFSLSIFRQNPVFSDGKRAPGKILITVKEGRYWHSIYKSGFFQKTAYKPQIAVWLEDESGRFTATLFVTRSTAVNDRKALPLRQDDTKKIYPLPVWTQKHTGAGIHKIETCAACHDKQKSASKNTTGNPLLDAVTGPTPETGFTREWIVPPELKPGLYNVFAEINNIFDYNDTYGKKLPQDNQFYNGVSGQPSVIWIGRIKTGAETNSVLLKPFGHSSSFSRNGEIFKNFEGITTAKDIVKSIEIKYSAN